MNDLVKLYLRVAHVDVDDVKKWNTLRCFLEKKDYAKAVLYLLRNCKLSSQDMMRENNTYIITAYTLAHPNMGNAFEWLYDLIVSSPLHQFNFFR